MKYKMLFLACAGMALGSFTQSQASKGLITAIGFNALCSAAAIKCVDMTLKNNPNVADEILIGTVSIMAHAVAPLYSSWVYNKTEGVNANTQVDFNKRFVIGASSFAISFILNGTINSSMGSTLKTPIFLCNLFASALSNSLSVIQ